jgi:hypothetical protein
VKVTGDTRRYELPVSLRGTLAHEYLMRNQDNPAKASVWIRQLVKDAFDHHPELLTKLEVNRNTQTRRYLIGRRDEVGMYPPDW